MALKTRPPTGRPSWPIILLAGAEKAGKSYAAAAFSASDLIDRTFWIEIGEGAADMYGSLPGARYEIVEHDGSYRGILQAVQDVTAVPTRGKPHAVVIDSMTELWELLCNEQQAVANNRRSGKAGSDATITMDQWNAAKRRWRRIIEPLRGVPTIMTARFEQVTAMDKNGKPTPNKEWKIRAEKNLPFEVDAIVEIPHPREYYLTGVRTVAFDYKPHMPLPGFTVDKLFRQLGLDGQVGPRAYIEPVIDDTAGVPEPDDPDDRPVTAEEIAGQIEWPETQGVPS